MVLTKLLLFLIFNFEAERYKYDQEKVGLSDQF